MKTWKKISSKKVHSNPRFSVFEDSVLLPDGSRGKYYYRKSKPGVGVIAFDGKKIYLVNQYRYGVKKRLWEVPVGRSENKNFLAQAKKELKEETGIMAKNWEFLGKFFPTPGSGNACGIVFFAKSLSFGEPHREASESDMFMGGFTLKQIDAMIKKSLIQDSWSVTALYFFKLKHPELL